MTGSDPKNTSLPESGSLEATPFSSLLLKIGRAKKSGWLRLKGEKLEKAFYFSNGLPSGSRSNVPNESLAKITVVRGKASREVVEGLGVQLLDDTAVAKALLEKKAVSEADLAELLRFQILLRLSDVFPRKDLRFDWPNASAPAKAVPVNAFQMFSEGIAKRVSKQNLDTETAGLADMVPHLAVDTVFRVDASTLPSKATQLFRRVDGRTTFGELVESVTVTAAPDQKADAQYRAWVYLLALLEGGFVQLDKPSTEAKPAAATVPPAQPESREAAPQPASPAAPADDPGEQTAEGKVMVVTQAGKEAVEYREVDDPELTERYLELKDQDYYTVLGISEDATDSQVKKAYFKMAKAFHPDKLYNHQDRTVKKFADKAFSLINTAFESLKTAEKRKHYSARLKELAEGIDLEAEAEDLLRSEVEFQKGQVFFRQKNWESAAKQFRLAIELNPREHDYFVYGGWAEFQLYYPDNEPGWKGAVQLLEKALEFDPNSYVAKFYLGNVSKLAGDLEKAEKYFREVLKVRPHHVEAQRELRLMEQRRAKEEAEGGKKKVLNKLFK